MSYRIIVEFPDEATAEKFIGGLMDGFGENECEFTQWRRVPGTDGTLLKHYERVTFDNMPVCFCKSVGPTDNDEPKTAGPAGTSEE